MSREWQQTRFREFVMPDAVYYQAIWAVRDLDRMREKLTDYKHECKRNVGSSVVMDSRVRYGERKPTEKEALEAAALAGRVKAIDDALKVVPEIYRDIVYSNVAYKENLTDKKQKIWKIWKQRFLFNVAKNLSLM